MKNRIKGFSQFINENRKEEKNTLDFTIGEFMMKLRSDYNRWAETIHHEDDRLSLWDFYYELEREYERDYGIRMDRETENLEYTSRNSNWTDPYDDDEEDYY